MKHQPSERGQAIVLIVFAIFGLLAMAALAIDIGQLFAARRNAQNAADAAALAAAYDAAAGSKDADTALEVAYQMAQKNGFKQDDKTVWVRVNNPPVENEGYCPDCGVISEEEGIKYYQVLITQRLNPIFSQFIFSGLKEFTVEAIAHSTEADDASAGNALFALSEKEDEIGIDMDGKVSIDVTGGNIRANGNMTRRGQPQGSSIKVGTSDHIYYGGSWDGRYGTFTGVNEDEEAIIPEWDQPVHIGKFAPPACPASVDDAADWSSTGGVKYKADETYGSTTYVHASELKSTTDLPAGIHCFYAGMSLTGGDRLTGSDVLIVIMGGDVKMTGNSTFDLSAATDMKDSKGNQWGGMVFYVPSSNPGTFRFGGTDGGALYGVVYAPKGTCDVGGTPDNSAIHSAIICNTIKVHGNPTLTIKYVPEELFHFPPQVELVQ